MLRESKFVYRPCEKCGEAFPKRTKRQKICLKCKHKIYATAGQVRKQKIYNAKISPKWFSKRITFSGFSGGVDINSILIRR